MEEEDYLEELKDKDLDQLNDDEDGESGNSLDSSKVPDKLTQQQPQKIFII